MAPNVSEEALSDIVFECRYRASDGTSHHGRVGRVGDAYAVEIDGMQQRGTFSSAEDALKAYPELLRIPKASGDDKILYATLPDRTIAELLEPQVPDVFQEFGDPLWEFEIGDRAWLVVSTTEPV